MKKTLRIFLVALLVLGMIAQITCFAAPFVPSPGREDVEIFDEDITDVDVPLGDLPDIAAVTVIRPPVDNETAEVMEDEIAKAVESVEAGLTDAILVVPQTDEVGKVSLIVPAASISLVTSKTRVPLIVSVPAGTVIVPVETLDVLDETIGSSDLEIVITPCAPSVGASLLAGIQLPGAQGADQVTEVTVFCDGKKITSFSGKSLTILLPVIDDGYFVEGEKYDVMQISDNGVVDQLVGTCVRMGETLGVQVTVTHLSTFVVLREPVDEETDDIIDANVPLVESPQTGDVVSPVAVMMILMAGMSVLMMGYAVHKKI